MFLEEIWSRNFTNLFIAPIKLSEIIATNFYCDNKNFDRFSSRFISYTILVFQCKIRNTTYFFVNTLYFLGTLGLLVTSGLIDSAPFENIAWAACSF